MEFQTRFSSLALILLFEILLIGCSDVASTESLVDTPIASATAQVPLPTNTPTLDVEISALLSHYGWTINQQISTFTITMPKSFQHYPGDFPYTIYWAYNNEFNKAIGLDLVPYLGQTVQANLYLLNETLPEEFYPITTAYAVIVTYDSKIIGAWIDKGRHYGFACSLDKKNFKEIVKQDWRQWLVSSGVVDISNDVDKELSQKSPEEIIEMYYKSMNEHNSQLFRTVLSRERLTRSLFVNKDEVNLFNHQEDNMFAENLESVHLVKIESLGFSSDCLPVYGALVDFQFVNPDIPTIPEGTSLRFLVLKEEISGLGWRIDEDNTGQGYSDECAP